MKIRYCLICGRKLSNNPYLVDTRDAEGHTAFVGAECFKQVKAAGADGFQPTPGLQRYWVLPAGGDFDALRKRAINY